MITEINISLLREEAEKTAEIIAREHEIKIINKN